METGNQETKGFLRWVGESVTLKLFVIGIVALLLLIPTSMIRSLITERAYRQESVVQEIGQSWSNPQTIGGPLLMIPFETDDVIKYVYLLPERIEIKANAQAENLKRGIYTAAVYQAEINLLGHFRQPDLTKLGVTPAQLQLEQARMVVGLGDLKGLRSQPTIEINGERYEAEGGFSASGAFEKSMVVPMIWPLGQEEISFHFALDLQGNDYLKFQQLARETRVSVEGNWNSPSFVGDFLPTDRNLGKDSFSASWEVVHFSRPLPQEWTAETTTLVSDDIAATKVPINTVTMIESFGVQFLQPVDHYHKSERAAKYALLIIALTFVSLFFAEMITKQRVHIIQYLLIGGAMVVFYSLLLSLSEFVGFDLAYGIAALATVLLIGSFIYGLLKQRRVAMYFIIILTVFYGLIFLLIQLTDTALLVGSIGLFFIVSVLMYFSRKIKWHLD